MTLPASGPLSMSQIAAEFGGSTPHSLSEYYRGGGLVPNTPANAGIPTAGQISLSNFYGGSASTVFVQNITSGYYAGGGSNIDWIGYNDGTLGGGIPQFGTHNTDTMPSPLHLRAFIMSTPTAAPATRVYDLQINGFSADPGQLFLEQLLIGASALAIPSTGYQWFPGGLARWTWSAAPSYLSNGVSANISIGLNL